MIYRDKLTGKEVRAARVEKPGTLGFAAAQEQIREVLATEGGTLGHYDLDVGCWFLPVLGGSWCAYPGEWVLRDDNDRPWPVTDKSFHANYEEPS